MLPDKALNIYPKSNENIEALISFYFSNYEVDQRNAVELLQKETNLTLNQCEYIIKNISEAFIPVFKRHLNGQIALGNLIQYGIDALENESPNLSGSKSRQMITKEFKDFVIEKN